MRILALSAVLAMLLAGCMCNNPPPVGPSGNFYNSDLTPTNNGEGITQ